MKSFPFTASARLPGAGSISIRGAVGPINPQDLSLTSFTVHIDVRHLNPAAAGVLDASSGVSGVIDRISIDAARSGHGLHIAKLLIDSPQLAITRAANRPAPALDGNPAPAPAAAPDGNSMMSALSADSLQVKGGVITITTAGQPARAAVYRQVDLALANYSPTTSSSFTLSAQFPGGGSLISSGNAGPLNRQNVAGTPIDAEISLKRVDLAASGWLPAGSSIGGLLNLDATAASDGHTLNANGVADVEGLRLAKSGSPSPKPDRCALCRDPEYAVVCGPASALHHHPRRCGAQRRRAAFRPLRQPLKSTSRSMLPASLIDQLQPFLPSVGIKLPAGSGLQGGTFNTSLNVTGPIDDPVISGPLQLDNTQLAGFNLGSNLSSISALTGLAPDSATAIRSLSMNLRVEHGVIRTDNLALVVPALGSATGSGTIGAGGALDYHVILKVGARRSWGCRRREGRGHRRRILGHALRRIPEVGPRPACERAEERHSSCHRRHYLPPNLHAGFLRDALERPRVIWSLFLTSRTAATGANFPECKERGVTNTGRILATSDTAIGKIRPVPPGCGENRAILRCHPCMGTCHTLRTPPRLAPFSPATLSALEVKNRL